MEPQKKQTYESPVIEEIKSSIFVQGEDSDEGSPEVKEDDELN